MRLKGAGFSLLIALALPSVVEAQAPPSAAVFNNIKSALENIIKWLKPDRFDAFTDARFSGVNKNVSDILQWSGARGVLLQVNVARSNADPNYKIILDDQPVIIGAGSSVIDAAASAPNTMTVGVPDGYKYSLDDSYYVWATPKSNGKISYQAQFAEGTRATNRDILEEVARRTVDASITRRANRAIVDGMLRHYEGLQQGATARQQARALRDRLAALQQRVDQNGADLKRELDRQAKLQTAAAAVDRFAAVLQFATVLSNAIASIDAGDRPSISDAKTPDELKKALSDAFKDATQKVEGVSAVQIKTRSDLNTHQQNIRVLLNNNGAPQILTLSTLTITP